MKIRLRENQNKYVTEEDEKRLKKELKGIDNHEMVCNIILKIDKHCIQPEKLKILKKLKIFYASNFHIDKFQEFINSNVEETKVFKIKKPELIDEKDIKNLSRKELEEMVKRKLVYEKDYLRRKNHTIQNFNRIVNGLNKDRHDHRLNGAFDFLQEHGIIFRSRDSRKKTDCMLVEKVVDEESSIYYKEELIYKK